MESEMSLSYPEEPPLDAVLSQSNPLRVRTRCVKPVSVTTTLHVTGSWEETFQMLPVRNTLDIYRYT